jgi:hypothetical protein
MDLAQIWRECYDRKKKRTVVWPAMFFSGFKLQPEKNTTGKKKVQSSCLTSHFFRQVQITTRKITTGKIKGTVVWPMEAAEIWWECYDGKKKTYSHLAGYVFQRVQITTGKIMTGKKRYSRLAVSWKQEKITSGKNKVQSSGRWLEDKTQNTTHIIDTTTNKMSHATLPSSGFAPSLSMGGAVAPPNHGTAAPQHHAQRYRVKECLVL